MILDLQGRHALVCGGSEGIGRAAAQELASLGADVTLLARREAPLIAACASLPRLRDAQTHAWRVIDLAQLAELRLQLEALLQARPVHIVVNNTGGPPGGALAEAEGAALAAVFAQHILAAQTILQAVLPSMRAAGYGRIINVISTSVKEPIPALGVSNTVRGAMASWSKTLATELGPLGITVNNVLPGYTRTQRLDQILSDRAKASGKPVDAVAAGMLATVPAGRFATPDEPAAAIAFLASPAAAYINGINLPVDGGRTKSL